MRRSRIAIGLALLAVLGAGAAGLTGFQANPAAAGAARATVQLQEFPVPKGKYPHDVAPAPDGTVWYSAQVSGEAGRLDPATGETRHVSLGPGAHPHGVIVGPDGAAWLTDGGLDALVRVDPATEEVKVFRVPGNRTGTSMNTAAFDRRGTLWFTGQSGIYGRLDPSSGELQVWDAPRGYGPYGITGTPNGDVYFASLAGNYVGRIDIDTGAVTVLEPPTPKQGARRAWTDSAGRIWVSEWNAGQLGLYDPATDSWREWKLPAPAGGYPRPQAYAVYVDDRDIVWLTDWGANALVRFDPATEAFEVYPLPSAASNVRQLLGRPGEVWLAGSGIDKLILARTE